MKITLDNDMVDYRDPETLELHLGRFGGERLTFEITKSEMQDLLGGFDQPETLEREPSDHELMQRAVRAEIDPLYHELDAGNISEGVFLKRLLDLTERYSNWLYGPE